MGKKIGERESILTRRGFLQSMGLITGAAIVAPAMLLGEPTPTPRERQPWEHIDQTFTANNGKRYRFKAWIRRHDLCEVNFYLGDTMIHVPVGLPADCKITAVTFGPACGFTLGQMVETKGKGSYVDLDEVAVYDERPWVEVDNA